MLQLAESGPDADFRVAAQEELAKIDEVAGQTEMHGLLITNLELIGTAANIQAFNEHNSLMAAIALVPEK